MSETMAERIMEAAEGLAIAAVEEVRRGSRSSRLELEASRTILAALVTEATTPPPERVCRWVRHRHDSIWLTQGCSGHYIRWPEDLPNFCPDCGGRVEEAKEPAP